MNTVLVRNLAEFNAALQRDDLDVIDVDSPAELVLEVSDRLLLADGEVKFHGTIRLYGESRLRAHDRFQVAAHDHSTVWAWNHVTVCAYDWATIWAYDNVTVDAEGWATIWAYDESSVHAWDDVTVYADGWATIWAYDHAHVEATGQATIWAFDEVWAKGAASATIWAHNGVTVEAALRVVVHVVSGQAAITGGILIRHQSVKELYDPQAWCQYEGVQVVDGIATVFKAVNDQWTGPDNWTFDWGPDYPSNLPRPKQVFRPGTTPVAADWRPSPTMGEGLHFSPSPALAFGRYPEATHIVAAGVEVATLCPIPAGKVCKVPKVVVACREVGLDGQPIEAEL